MKKTCNREEIIKRLAVIYNGGYDRYTTKENVLGELIEVIKELNEGYF